MTKSAPTVVILGPTGSGKTTLSIKLAQQIGGAIISADSRTIYKGLNIGTAKPTLAEQQGITHYGFDLVYPDQCFTAADWVAYAKSKLELIKKSGQVPIIVGGTGLYIDALIFDYDFHGPTGHKIGDIEQKTCSDRTNIKGHYLLIGVDWPIPDLRIRLEKRVDQMFNPSLYAEVKKLVQKYGWSNQAMKSNIYRFAWSYLSGSLTLTEAKKRCFYADYHLAKRQLTWFRRNPSITWLPYDQVIKFITAQLNQA